MSAITRWSLRASAASIVVLWVAACPGKDPISTGDGGGDSSGPCSRDTYRKCDTGYPGVCAEGEQSCLPSLVWGPCEAKIQPGSQAESCTNDVDDDCDGYPDGTDMDCVACTPGDSRDCTAISTGICTDGQQICNDEQSWGVCGPKIRPGSVPEDCGNGLDDDCDGKVDAADDDCDPCTPNTQRTGCNTGLSGICSTGSQICGANSMWGPCTPDVRPSQQPEDCTTTNDEDCDGTAGDADTDCQPCQPNDPPQACPTGLDGICATGTQSCTANNIWGPCQVVIAKDDQPENCNQPGDEDCDGLADSADDDCWECQPSDPPQTCTVAGKQGLCQVGERRCVNGSWSTTCTQTVFPRSEDCADALSQDEDCDGTANGSDSDCYDCQASDPPQTCDTGEEGSCQWGERRCVNGAWSTTCTQTTFPQDEVCNDALAADEDCDGLANAADTDSGCCASGASESCDAGNPYCEGTRSCTNNVWGDCGITTRAETGVDFQTGYSNACDGEDDDCNGTVDNGTFLKSPIYAIEYLPASVTWRLVTQNTNVFLFARAQNSPSTGRWAMWNGWAPTPSPAVMLTAGDNLHERLNRLTSTPNYFTLADINNASAIMVGPPGFPNSHCSGSGCLILFRSSWVKMVNLGTGATPASLTYLSSFPWQTTGTTAVRAATGFPAGTFKDQNGTPSADSVVVLVNGPKCWFWTPSGGVLVETTAEACFCHPSGGNQSCPSAAVLNNLDGLTYFPANDTAKTPHVGIGSGGNHYISPMLNGTSQWAITYSWSAALPIDTTYKCDHAPLQ